MKTMNIWKLKQEFIRLRMQNQRTIIVIVSRIKHDIFSS